MNAIFFASKRVFHSAVNLTRRSMQAVAPGMTAARFDMMYALTRRSWDENKFDAMKKLRQSELWRTLGVSPPVVARMLRSLEALGWVTRRRPAYGDQRQREVTLTEKGLACIREAYKTHFRIAERIVYHAICWGKHRDAGARWVNMSRLESYLNSLREHCRDRAQLYLYPWGHPDD
jgi:DNA-binding MarR family transcriptional regulator